MGSSLVALLAIGGALWLWVESRRSHERAVRTVRRVVQSHGMQLLDDTVALKGLRLMRTASGRVGVSRTYSFEVSVDGYRRHAGSVTLCGGAPQVLDLPTPDT